MFPLRMWVGNERPDFEGRGRAGDGKRIDPLVINFDGSAAQLTDTKFAFDLNADGTKESVSFLKPGSGFLVLDKDGGAPGVVSQVDLSA